MTQIENHSPTIRLETPADYAAIREILVAAFERPSEADLVEALRNAPEYCPDLALVAEMEGGVVGHILFTRVTVDNQPSPLLGLAPVAVAPAWQRQGVGSALIREGVRRAVQGGYAGVVLLGHPAYYPRFGFVPASRFGLRSIYPVPDEAFMALPLHSGSLDGISGTVRYASAFDDVE